MSSCSTSTRPQLIGETSTKSTVLRAMAPATPTERLKQEKPEAFIQLHEAISNEDAEKVKEIVAKIDKKDINKDDFSYFTPLRAAVEVENLDILKTLLENEAEVDQQSIIDGRTALMLAVDSLWEEGTEALLQAAADPLIADKLGLDAVMHLVEAAETLEEVELEEEEEEGEEDEGMEDGGDAEKAGEQVKGAEGKKEQVGTGAEEEGEDEERTASIRILHMLLSKAPFDVHTRVDEQSQTALLKACMADDVDLAAALLQADGGGAALSISDTFGSTPMSWVAEEGSGEMAKVLVHVGGVDVNARYFDKGCTALELAAAKGNVDVVNALLSIVKDDMVVVDVDAQDADGDTALIEAARKKREDILQMLIDAGADINIKNKQDQAAVDVLPDVYIFRLLSGEGEKRKKARVRFD